MTELEKAHEARRQAQRELADLKERMARSRIDLMRELREQGWTAPAQQAEPPEGWVTWWPRAGGGDCPVYSHGPDKPSYGPELNALLRIYPVFAQPTAQQERQP